ncbi:MAG: hypothetical protein CFE43_03520 [Burkholderiales bacterium PBB3]|nr:MAG: hypothetical protein CFE43_03520 [Burkholderiales bacterium PBB3]
MKKNIAAYAATLLLMVALDMLWLGLVATSWYQQGIGHLMAEDPKIGVAVVFYAVYALGLMVFVVLPAGKGTADGGWGTTLVRGALFGFFAYATYDLTNWATLKNWPGSVALVDMAWGAVVSSLSAAAGKWAWDRC